MDSVVERILCYFSGVDLVAELKFGFPNYTVGWVWSLEVESGFWIGCHWQCIDLLRGLN